MFELKAASTIARMTYLEARRDKVVRTAWIFAVLLVGMSVILEQVTFTAYDRIVRDAALATIHLFGLAVAVFLGVSAVSRELERKTIFLLVSKPVSRGAYVLGKIAGITLTLSVTLGLMTAALLVQQAIYGVVLHPVLFATCWLFLIELVVISSFAVFASTWMSPLVSGFAAAGLFVIGELSPDLYELSQRAESTGSKVLLKTLYYALPNLDRLNLKDQASILAPVDWGAVGASTLYGLVVAACFVVAAAAVLRKKDLK